MTLQVDRRKVGEITVIDTPGLEDPNFREEAAKQISHTLKQGGYYRVVFVLTLKSGRVRPHDITVINLVLESAPEIKQYGVIVNKLSERVIKTLVRDSNNRIIRLLSIMSGQASHKSFSIPFLLQNFEELEDLGDVTMELPELEQLMRMLPCMNLHPERVSEIDINKFDKYTRWLEDSIFLGNYP